MNSSNLMEGKIVQWLQTILHIIPYKSNKSWFGFISLMLYFHAEEQQQQNENIFAARELLSLFSVIMVATFSPW